MSIAATLGIKITSSKFSYFATQSPDQAKYLRPNNVLCIVFSFFSFSLSLSFITRFIILLRSSRCCVLSAPIATNAEKKLFANRLKQKKDRTVVRKTNLHLLCRYVVCVRCVWLKSSAFPLISWTSCASMYVRHVQPTPHGVSECLETLKKESVVAPALCLFHGISQSEFHCVHGKLHRINFSSRRLVFSKFIFHLCVALPVEVELFFRRFPFLRVFHSSYFVVSLFSLFIFIFFSENL